ncbi:odorant receptor 10-like [Temnothorax americanus]|uniref:odorant receptor 10-like n=1 Tax=Temnothorax americanus TaxID=1964332 RepID=UPI004067A872
MTGKGKQSLVHARLPLALLHMTGIRDEPARDLGIVISPRLRRHADIETLPYAYFSQRCSVADDSMRDRSQLPGRIHNVEYEHDIRYAVQLCRWILNPIGIWHLIHGRSSQSEKLLSLMLILACFFSLCFVLVPAIPYILLREKDIDIKVKLFGPVGFCLTSAVKYCFLRARVLAIGRCVEHVESDWQIVRHQDHRKMMLRNALIGRRLTTLCVIFLYTGGMSYHTIMPLSSAIANTKTNGSFTSRPLVYPGYDIYFDPQASPAYEIVFFMHCLSAMIQYSATTAACSLAATFATHACGQVQILMTLLDDLVDGKRIKGTVEKRLSLIAKHHVRVLRFTADVEEILREICLLELVAATLIICLLEYYCLMEWENSDAVAIFTYFILLISLTFNILIFCYIGQLLVEEFVKIGSAAYEVNWYDLSGHQAVDLVMIITMSHYPPKLTAGKFCDLSLNTFSTVLKTSVVYLNLLRTVTQ